MESIKRIFSVTGCASRTEFWVVVLGLAVVVLGPAFVFFEPYSKDAKLYVDIAALVTLWPLIAVQVRRWHDRNKSGWWVLINFVPVIGFFWVLVENGFLPGIADNNVYK